MKPKEYEITEELRGHRLSFKTTHGLFSYKEVDKGTKLLINSIDVRKDDTSLDLGCGYGPIGITLAKLNPSGMVYLTDRDFVAVDYVKINCDLNGIDNYKVLLSNGFSNLENLKFDLIASNLPTHMSNEMLSWIIYESKKYLKSNGRFYIVTVSKLKKFIQREFEEVYGNYEKISSDKMYTVSFASVND